MSLEDMAKKYSERWGVTREEAMDKVKSFLAQNPSGKAEGEGEAPTRENPFVNPLGPLSKKIQDVNQAIYSAAYTRSAIRDLNLPPEQLQTLDKRVERLESDVSEVLKTTSETVKELQKTMEAKNQEEFMRQIDERINPLKEKLEKLGGPASPTTPPQPPRTATEIIAEADQHIEAAKIWLGNRGYKVVPEATLSSVGEKVVEESAEEVANKLRAKGYEVRGPPTWEDINKLVAQAKDDTKKEVAKEMESSEKKLEMIVTLGSSIGNALLNAFSKPELEGAMKAVAEAVSSVRKAASTG